MHRSIDNAWKAWGAAAVLVVSGCGGAAPSDDVPELSDELSRVDTAIAEREYRKARRHLNDLVRTTVESRESGDLGTDQADRILAAAARLMSALPRSRPKPAPTAPATPAETPEEKPDEEKEEEKKDEEEKDEKKGEKSKGEGSEDGGGGNGDSGENGPGDGEGN